MTALDEHNRRQVAQAADCAQCIVLQLALGDALVLDLATAAGCSRPTVDRMLRDALYGMVHVDRWVYPHANGALTAMWTLGPGVDARKSDALSARPHRAPKELDDPEDWFDDRAKQLAASTRPFRHPMDIVLYGPAA